MEGVELSPRVSSTNGRADGRRRAGAAVAIATRRQTTQKRCRSSIHTSTSGTSARFKLRWLKGAPGLDRSFLMKDYRQATEGLNVVKSVYMEVDVEPSQQAAEADYVLDLIRKGETPLVAAVIARPAGVGRLADFIDRYQASHDRRPSPGAARSQIRRRGTALNSGSSTIYGYWVRKA